MKNTTLEYFEVRARIFKIEYPEVYKLVTTTPKGLRTKLLLKAAEANLRQLNNNEPPSPQSEASDPSRSPESEVFNFDDFKLPDM